MRGNSFMNILQTILSDYFEYIIYGLPPRHSVVENVSFISRRNILKCFAIMVFMPNTINKRKNSVSVFLLKRGTGKLLSYRIFRSLFLFCSKFLF